MMEKYPFSEQIITGFFEGTLDPAAHHRVLDWLSTLPAEKQAEFMELHWNALQQMGKGEQAQDFQFIENHLLHQQQRKLRIKRQILKIAAVVVPLTVIGLLWQYQPAPLADPSLAITKAITAPAQTVHVANLLSENKLVELPDQSTVTLYPGSEINYTDGFKGNTRAVNLVGKAFFNVKHLPSKPFSVKTGAITTVVLGTSFWVNAVKGAATISVRVKTGKVGVVHGHRPALFLLPSEKAVFDLTSNLLAKVKPERIKPAEIPAALPATLAFNETPLKQVARALSENFNVQILIDESVNTDLPVSLNTKGKTITEILESIKSQIPVDYEIDKKQIRIKRKP